MLRSELALVSCGNEAVGPGVPQNGPVLHRHLCEFTSFNKIFLLGSRIYMNAGTSVQCCATNRKRSCFLGIGRCCHCNYIWASTGRKRVFLCLSISIHFYLSISRNEQLNSCSHNAVWMPSNWLHLGHFQRYVLAVKTSLQFLNLSGNWEVGKLLTHRARVAQQIGAGGVGNTPGEKKNGWHMKLQSHVPSPEQARTTRRNASEFKSFFFSVTVGILKLFSLFGCCMSPDNAYTVICFLGGDGCCLASWEMEGFRS